MIKLGIVMDSIENIKIERDSSILMLLEAQNREYEIYYMELNDLYLLNNKGYGSTWRLIEKLDKKSIKRLKMYSVKQELLLKDLDVILMRKDPPFNLEYIYATYILERAEQEGVLIINKPQSLRDYNEKIFSSVFPDLIPNTLVTRDCRKIYDFYLLNFDIILKPLDKMGGSSVFRIKKNDSNVNVIIETLTNYGQSFCLAQTYVPEIKYGDKRILIINGIVIPHVLARIPKKNEIRGNLSSGGIGEVRELTSNDWKIAKFIAPFLKEQGLFFVGIDVIGNYLTEINITSPTCIQEIERAIPSISIVNIFFDEMEKKINKK